MDKQLPELSEQPDRIPVESRVVPLQLCPTHTRDTWQAHFGYVDNHDGSISCKFCPWGTLLPGYMRCLEGRIVDLRIPTGK